MKFYVTFAFIIFSFGVSGQSSSYWALTGKGEYLYRKKEYSASLEAYNKAFQIRKDKAGNIYDAACSAALAGKKDMAISLLRDAIKAGYLDFKHLQSDADLVTLHSTKEWPVIIAQAEKNAVDIPKTYNTALRNELLAIGKDDQDIRVVFTDSIKKYGFKEGNPVIDSIRRILIYKDSINLVKIAKLLDKNGYPSVKQVGSDAALNVFLVIQHSDRKTQERFFSVLKKAVDKADLHPANFALLQDRLALRQGRKQVYGSQVAGDKTTGNYYVLPLEDPDNVDQRRMDIGLEPLTEYIKQWNIVWDVNDYKQKLAQGLIKNTMQ